MTIDRVQKLRGHLEEALLTEHPIVIVTSALKRFDIATVQLLYTFARTARNQGRKIRWPGVSDVLIDAIGLPNLEDEPNSTAV